MLNKTPLLHQSSGPRVSLSLSLSLSLFQAYPLEHRGSLSSLSCLAPRTLSRRCSASSPHWEGAWGLHEQSKPRAGALLAFCVNQGISVSFSPLLSYRRLQTTKFRSIKGPQQTDSSNYIIGKLCPGYNELLRIKVGPPLCVKWKCWEETSSQGTFERGLCCYDIFNSVVLHCSSRPTL